MGWNIRPTWWASPPGPVGRPIPWAIHEGQPLYTHTYILKISLWYDNLDRTATNQFPHVNDEGELVPNRVYFSVKFIPIHIWNEINPPKKYPHNLDTFPRPSSFKAGGKTIPWKTLIILFRVQVNLFIRISNFINEKQINCCGNNYFSSLPSLPSQDSLSRFVLRTFVCTYYCVGLIYFFRFSSSTNLIALRAQRLINLEIPVLYDHWSQATLSSVSTWMGDCSSIAWVLLLTLKVG